MSIHCQNCQDHLLAYTHNDLSPHRARRVRAHLDRCAACYAAYAQQRDAARMLSAELRPFGAANPAQLDALWAGVERQINMPITRNSAPAWRRGLVGVALMMLCALPWTITFGNIVAASTVPVRAAPVEMPSVTPAGTETHSQERNLFTLSLPTEDAAQPTPTSTPAVAPVPDQQP